LDQKSVLVFGTELAGLTPVALELADDFIRIPMVGFTESLNISVSAAILIQALSARLRTSDVDWQLMEIEKEQIMLNWLRNSINRSDVIISNYVELNNSSQLKNE
jgi:tRNA (guanosine-2'-O-)-methyltransferase